MRPAISTSSCCRSRWRAKASPARSPHGALRGALGHEEGINIQGEAQKAIDVYANEVFLRTTEWTGVIAGMASEEMEQPYMVPAEHPRGKYLLLFDPLDGSSNIDVNVAVGSIFSVLRLPEQDTVGDGGRLPPAGRGAGGRRLRDLRPLDDARAHRRPRRRRVHARPRDR